MFIYVIACSNDNLYGVVVELISNYANIEAKDILGRSPLIFGTSYFY